MPHPTNASLAVCGLDCSACRLFRAHTDRAAAEPLHEWFRSQGWIGEEQDLQAFMAQGPYCLGCRGDRETHWSDACALLHCCVDEKHLAHCSQCDEFACDRLTAWAESSERYAAALERLRAMREA